MVQQCYLCGNHVISNTSICAACKNQRPRLVAGAKARAKLQFIDESPKLGDSIGWYMTSRYSKYADHRGSSFENVIDQSEEEIIDELKTAIRNFGRENTLTHLVVSSMASKLMGNDPSIGWDYVLLPAQAYRYCFGLIASIEDDDLVESSHYLDVIHPLRKFLLKPNKIDYTTSEDPSEEEYTPFESSPHDIMSHAQNRELTVSRIAFDGQFIDGMRRGYTPFQHEFLEYTDIDMDIFVDYSISIAKVIGDRLMEIADSIRSHESDCLRTLGEYAQRVESDSDYPVSEFAKSDVYDELKKAEQISLNELIKRSHDRLWIGKNELKSHIQPKYDHKFDNYLERMSINLGDGSMKSPFEFNPIDRSPLIQSDGKFLIIPPMFFAYALSKTFIYDLRDLAKEIDNFDPSDRWGSHVEHWTYDILRSTFDRSSIHRSVDYKVDDTRETDFLLKDGNTLFVIECKAKALTQGSKKGEFKTIQNDFEEGINKGAKQAHIVIEGIKNNSIKYLNDHEELEIDNSDIDTYIPIVVVRDHYDRLATKEYVHLINEEYRIPYVIGIYNLEILVDAFLIEDMKEYILERIYMNKKGYVAGNDERDYMGAAKSGMLDKMKPILEAGFDEQPSIQHSLKDYSDALPQWIAEKHSITPSEPIYFQ